MAIPGARGFKSHGACDSHGLQFSFLLVYLGSCDALITVTNTHEDRINR